MLAYVPEEVFSAVTPMLAMTHGKQILLSTPRGSEGYFYRCFHDDAFKSFHISTEDCPRRDVEHLKREKQRMSKLVYAQEYLGKFISDLRQFFPDSLIRDALSVDTTNSFPVSTDTYLGVDIARQGRDQSVFISVAINEDKIRMFDMQITEKTYLTDSIDIIKALYQRYHYRKIYIDSAGIGAGVFDVLLKEPNIGSHVVSIENARKSLTKNKRQKKRLLKEDIYSNLKWLLESKKLKLWKDEEIYLSLSSIQYEYNDQGGIKISGDYGY